MTTKCIHYWICSRPRRGDNGEWVTHEKCRYCGGERDLIETIDIVGGISEKDNRRIYTEIKYPEREGKMTNTFTSENYAERKRHSEEYKKRKPEIIKVFSDCQSIKLAATRLNMPSSTLRGLLIKWHVYQPGIRTIEKLPEDNIPPSVSDIENNSPQSIFRFSGNVDIITLVDKALEESDIHLARAYWHGIKSTIGAAS